MYARMYSCMYAPVLPSFLSDWILHSAGLACWLPGFQILTILSWLPLNYARIDSHWTTHVCIHVCMHLSFPPPSFLSDWILHSAGLACWLPGFQILTILSWLPLNYARIDSHWTTHVCIHVCMHLSYPPSSLTGSYIQPGWHVGFPGSRY